MFPAFWYSATSLCPDPSCTTAATKASGVTEVASDPNEPVKANRAASASYTKACPADPPSSIIIPPSSGLADPEFNKINLSST